MTILSQNKNRKITHQLPSQAKQTSFWENQFSLLSIEIDLGIEKQRLAY